MNQEIKTKWIEALRSGKYKQATNYLRTETGYCCLGVLCDIIDPSKWVHAESGGVMVSTPAPCQMLCSKQQILILNRQEWLTLL